MQRADAGAQGSVASSPETSGTPSGGGLNSMLKGATFAEGERALRPSREGVVTPGILWLRGAPRTGAGSAMVARLPRGTKLAIESDVASTDKKFPRWLEVKTGKLGGFVPTDYVSVDGKPPEEASATSASTDQPAGGPGTSGGPASPPGGSGGGGEGADTQTTTAAPKPIQPAKPGTVSTGDAWLQSQPGTDRSARKVLRLDQGTVVSVTSEVDSGDSKQPSWYGVDALKTPGYLPKAHVRLGTNTPKPAPAASQNAPQPATTPTAAAAPAGPAQTPVAGSADQLHSGLLERMRTEDEFVQADGYESKTLHKACVRAFELRGYKGATLTKKATDFRHVCCNTLALFFVEKTPMLKGQADAHKSDYPMFKRFVEDVLTKYFFTAFQSGFAKEDGITGNTPLNTKEGASSGDTPYAKAQGLLKCEGRMIRIYTGGHFFVGEVRGGVLYAYDNQNNRTVKGRSGAYDLKSITRETKSGDAYNYLSKTLRSASPAKEQSSAPKEQGWYGQTAEKVRESAIGM